MTKYTLIKTSEITDRFTDACQTVRLDDGRVGFADGDGGVWKTATYKIGKYTYGSADASEDLADAHAAIVAAGGFAPQGATVCFSNRLLSGVRCRLDGVMLGVGGPVTCLVIDRKDIAGIMCLTDSGAAAETISRTLDLLTEGKAVRLTSHAGWTDFQPLLPAEDGTQVPASKSTVYHPDGTIFQRTVGTVRQLWRTVPGHE